MKQLARGEELVLGALRIEEGEKLWLQGVEKKERARVLWSPMPAVPSRVSACWRRRPGARRGITERVTDGAAAAIPSRRAASR